MPEEDDSKYFLISLIVQQLYREMLSIADEMGGKLPNRIMFFLDEFGTLPPIQSAEMNHCQACLEEAAPCLPAKGASSLYTLELSAPTQLGRKAAASPAGRDRCDTCSPQAGRA